MKERHLLALSGGKDSAALAVYMREKYSHLPIEYVFIDSGCELPETYEYLDRIEAILGIEIIYIQSRRNFEYWLKYFDGVLPSPANRWCTRLLKLEPFEQWIKKECSKFTIYNYAGLRADEDRDGFKSKSEKVFSIFPFVNDGIILNDVKNILEYSGLDLPKYYSWRQRSGCYFCFFQRDDEWRGLRKYHPELFEKACFFEESHKDGRKYSWHDTGFLRNLSQKENLLPPERQAVRTNLINNLASSITCRHSNTLFK